MNKVIALLMAIVAFQSCKKDLLNQENEKPLPTNRSISNTLPNVKNGILFFNDENHLNRYYEYLEDMIDTNDLDSTLEVLESNFLYNSQRGFFNAKYDLPNGEFTSEEIEEMETNDFISDEIFKSIYNEDYEVGIDDKVFIKFDLNHTLMVNSDETGLIDIIRNIEKGSKANAIDLYKEYEGISILCYDIVATKALLEVNENKRYRSTSLIQNIECNTYTKELDLKLTLEQMPDTIWYSQNYIWNNVVINWGDNTNSTIGPNSTANTTHTYTSLGSKSVTVTYNFTDQSGDPAQLVDSLTIEVLNGCTTGGGEKWCSDQTSDIKMTAKLWVSHVVPKPNMNRLDLGCYTHLYRKNWKGNWVKAWGRVFTKIDHSNVRAEDCSLYGSVWVEKLRNWQREVQKTEEVYDNVYYGNGDIKSWHSVNKNGTYLFLAISYDPC